MPQRTEHRRARAQKRRGVHRTQLVRDRDHRFRVSDHILGVAAVHGKPGGQAIPCRLRNRLSNRLGSSGNVRRASRRRPFVRPSMSSPTDRASRLFRPLHAPELADKKARGNDLPLTSASPWQMPQASTLMRTSCSLGSGISRSTNSNSAPAERTWIAFIVGKRQPRNQNVEAFKRMVASRTMPEKRRFMSNSRQTGGSLRIFTNTRLRRASEGNGKNSYVCAEFARFSSPNRDTGRDRPIITAVSFTTLNKNTAATV